MEFAGVKLLNRGAQRQLSLMEFARQTPESWRAAPPVVDGVCAANSRIVARSAPCRRWSLRGKLPNRGAQRPLSSMEFARQTPESWRAAPRSCEPHPRFLRSLSEEASDR